MSEEQNIQGDKLKDGSRKRFLTEFANRMSHLRNALKAPYLGALNRADRKAKYLISLIEKEYHSK